MTIFSKIPKSTVIAGIGGIALSLFTYWAGTANDNNIKKAYMSSVQSSKELSRNPIEDISLRLERDAIHILDYAFRLPYEECIGQLNIAYGYKSAAFHLRENDLSEIISAPVSEEVIDNYCIKPNEPDLKTPEFKIISAKR